MLFFLAYFVYFEPTEAKKTLVIGETYLMENSPYPAEVKILDLNQKGSYNRGIVGDLIILLPEGSTEVRINRQDSICQFWIDFTLNGVRQTETWKECFFLHGLMVYPHEIYAK